MADSKITALTSISTSTDPANDPLVIVDVSDTSMAATGTTKKVTLNQLLGASGTATLASANITGDLTVRTTGLILNTSGLGVGISPTSFGAGYGTIQVSGATGSGIRMGSPTNGSFIYSDNTWLNILTETNVPHRHFVNNQVQYTVQHPGVFTWFDGAGGTRMTLNSTGLGIGLAPVGGVKLSVAGNIGLPNSCTASGETSGVFSIDVANLLTLNGSNWRQATLLLVYSGINGDATNSTNLQTLIHLTGLSTWNSIAKSDIVGTASVAVSNDTTTGATITVTVPTGNSGTAYVVLLGGAGATTRPSMTINA